MKTITIWDFSILYLIKSLILNFDFYQKYFQKCEIVNKQKSSVNQVFNSPVTCLKDIPKNTNIFELIAIHCIRYYLSDACITLSRHKDPEMTLE